MFESRNELLEKIRLGEDTYLELKEVRFAGERLTGPGQTELADELSAFANSRRGGVLLMGVQNKTREIVGIPVESLDAVEALVHQACRDSIKPPLVPVIERLTLPDLEGRDRPVLRVDVSPSLFVHLGPGGYLHRVGSSKREMPQEYLARLLQQRSQARIIRFDEQAVPRASLADLDKELWQRFLTDLSQGEPENLLEKLALVCRDADGTLRPTVTGVLLACRSPENFMPNAFIQAVKYQGTEIDPGTAKAYQVDAQDITGPLDQQIANACDFVRKHMKRSATKDAGGGREDLSEYDMLAVFEAVTNAVAHRDYSMAGSKIRLRLFDDRLELYSPGMLPNTMTPESLHLRQASRNEAIASLLARCPVPTREAGAHRRFIMDKRGEGVPIILKRSFELSGKKSEYRLIDDSELLLTIFAAKPQD